MLETPFELAGRRLRNRIVHASMTTLRCVNAAASPGQIQYHASRAKGGAAMTVTEPLNWSRMHDVPRKTRVWNDDNLEGLKRWADAVELHDCRLIGQVQDPGRARHHTGQHVDAFGPSALPDDLSWTMPRAMTRDEIRRFVDDVAQSAARLERCGWSGVEISCGHGHLFHQFLSPRSNIRDDEYGGSWENRVRFVAEMVAAIRAACGRGFIVGLKLPGDDFTEGSIGPAEAAIVAKLLTASGQASYACFAQGTHSDALDMHVPDRFGPRMPYRELIRGLRKAIPGVPLIALGRITDPAEAEALLAAGEAEMIGLGRSLIADPAWPIKAAQGRSSEIRYCISCNTCWDMIITRAAPMACVNNPRVAAEEEVDWWPKRAAKPRRVVVVGAGFAGMEAAWVAAARGHEVTVFGSGADVGGKARLRSHFPGGEEVSSVYDYQAVAAHKAGVRLELGVQASEHDIAALRPEVVVLATGASMVAPRWLPAAVAAEGLVPDLRSAMAGLIGVKARQPGAAVIFDMDHTDGTYASAEHLANLFESVTIITPRHSLADHVSLVTRQGILKRLARKRIRTVLLAEPVWSRAFEEEGALEYRHVYTGELARIENVAFLAFSTPRARNDALAGPLSLAGLDVRAIGDCRSPRDMIAATAEGHALGNEI